MTPLCIMKELSSYCPNGIFWSIYALLHLYEVAQRDAFALHIVPIPLKGIHVLLI
jgi:hypothetical protein